VWRVKKVYLKEGIVFLKPRGNKKLISLEKRKKLKMFLMGRLRWDRKN
jgi:hypothetical protein